MKLNKLTLRDRGLFNRFLKLKEHELAVYSFTNIYIWKNIFDISWQIIDKNLCIFFRDKIGCFLYLEPLGKNITAHCLRKVFQILDIYNRNPQVSRIENIEEKDVKTFEGLGYLCREKFSDYLCSRQDLAELKGNRFKHKRAACNHFVKNYNFKYLPFNSSERSACLKLYNSWMEARKRGNSDLIYQGMLEDSAKCLKILLDNYQHLNFQGRIVKIGNQLKGFSLGFTINKETFCILYEITDLSVRGLSQFIFRQFCRDAGEYKYINIMDDSGLEGLKKVKLSYRPVRLVQAYIATNQLHLRGATPGVG